MKQASAYSGYLGAIGLVVLASLVCEAVRPHLAPTNMVMAYLLAVVLAAVLLGRIPAILAALLSVLAFDVFFVPPRFSLRVSDTEYLITFFALFVVGVVISTLVATIKDKVEEARQQEFRASSLYYLTRDLAVASDLPAVVEALRQAVRRVLNTPLAVMFKHDQALEPMPAADSLELDTACREIADWVLQSGRRAGKSAAAFPNAVFQFFPIKAGNATFGVMLLAAETGKLMENLQLVEAFAAQVAMAYERVQLASQAEEARVLREKNQLEQALLNSISHDLRTPLVTISGVLDSLLDDSSPCERGKQRELLVTAADEATRLNRFVGNLLDMTRLEAGALALRKEPCDIEELIGCAVGAVESRLNGQRLITTLEPDLPLLDIDLALLTQALVNLLDNAVRYAPPGTDITLAAQAAAGTVRIAVLDQGPGVPPGEEERIFDRFYRVAVPEQSGGTGLGLCIAKGIVEAHQGSIAAVNSPQGGLLVTVTLPAAQLETVERAAQ